MSQKAFGKFVSSKLSGKQPRSFQSSFEQTTEGPGLHTKLKLCVFKLRFCFQLFFTKIGFFTEFLQLQEGLSWSGILEHSVAAEILSNFSSKLIRCSLVSLRKAGVLSRASRFGRERGRERYIRECIWQSKIAESRASAQDSGFAVDA